MSTLHPRGAFPRFLCFGRTPSSQGQPWIIIASSLFAIARGVYPAWGQVNLPSDALVPPVRPVDPNQPLENPAPEPPTPPILTEPAPLTAPTKPPLPAPRFLVRNIEVLGATVLQQEIAELVAPLEHKQLTLEQLLNLRTRIAQLYIDNGYITSGAFLPNNQTLTDGTVQIQVVEGEVEELQITGLKRLRPGYIRSRLPSVTRIPLNRNALEKDLQLLQLNPLIQRVNADLTAGSSPGRSLLLIEIQRAPAFHIGAAVDNYRSPAIGSFQGSLDIAHDNVLGVGDRFTGTTNITDGLILYDLGYRVPFNPLDGTLGVRYSTVESEIITDAFQDFDISNTFETLSFNLWQPVYKTPSSEFAVGFTFDLRESQSFLRDEPFSFTLGPDNGVAKTRVLRFNQEWIHRQTTHVLSIRSQFNVGLNVFNATINGTGPSGDFFSWIGQAQYVQQLPLRALFISRLSTQLTPDSLLTLERFGIGGAGTVRGYARNQILTDNGILVSVELQFPLTDARSLQLAPFLEVGKGWNNFGPDPNPSTLVGIGLGLRWQLRPDLAVQLDYGVPLVGIDNRGDSLQEQGGYFSLRYQPL